MLVFKQMYFFNVTEEPDEFYLKYLTRRAGALHISTPQYPHASDIKRLDISVDDEDGDVVAGIAAYTDGRSLHIDVLWVDAPLRGAGLGAKLVGMAEEIARERGCDQAQLQTQAATFYARFDYAVTGQMTHFPGGETLYVMHKPLAQEESAARKDSA